MLKNVENKVRKISMLSFIHKDTHTHTKKSSPYIIFLTDPRRFIRIVTSSQNGGGIIVKRNFQILWLNCKHLDLF